MMTKYVGRVYCFQSPSATIDYRPTYFVDDDEVRRAVVDGRRRGLEAVDPPDAPAGDHGRAMGVAVILVDVVRGMGVDDGRLDFRDDPVDGADRRVPFGDAG